MKFSLDDIKNDHCIKDFIRSREIRTSTIYEYACRIRDYSNYNGKGPSALIDEAESDEDKGIRLRNRKISCYVLDFVENLEKKGMSENSVKGYLEVITALYHYFDISTPRIKRNKKTTMNKAFEKIPNIEDVRKAVKVVSLRDKAIVLLMMSSGMGKSEIIHLTYGDFLDAIDDYLDLNDEDRIMSTKYLRNWKNKKM